MAVSSPRMQPFARRLPYWVSRTVDTPSGTIAVLVMKDGTIIAGLQVVGLDVYCSDNSTLNNIAGTLRDALNVLPPTSYVQAVYETGFDFKDVLRNYYKLVGGGVHPIMQEARRRRASMIAGDLSLSRTRISYYVGLRQALGELLPHGSKPSFFSFGNHKIHPTEITARMVLHAAEQLAHTLVQFRDRLEAAGIATTPYSEGELLTEIHRALNPVSSELVPAPVIVETKDDLERLQRGQRAIFHGPNLATQLPLASATFEADHFRLDEPALLHRALGLRRYPFATDPAWLFPAQYKYMPLTPMRLSITHIATDAQLKKEQLERKRNLLQAQQAKIAVDHDALAAYQEYEDLLSQLAKTDSRVFETSLVVLATAKNQHELDLATRAIQAGFAEAKSAVATLEHQQLLPWLSTLPGNGYRGPRPYPLLTANCAHLMPYFQPAIGENSPDFVFTTRHHSIRCVTWRQSGSRDNTNTFILGSTGSGKTFLLSHILKTTLSLGGHVVVADTKGPKNSTYRPMCDLLGGQYVALNAADETIAFNPCPEQSVARKADGSFGDAIDFLRDILCMMTVPDFDTTPKRDLYKRIAMEVIRDAYNATREMPRPPILSDVLDAFGRYRPTVAEFEPLAADMALRLRLWCEDRKRGALLNRSTKLSSTSPFQVFDFFGLADDPELAAVLISTLSARIFDKMQSLPLSTPKLFIFDEAWAFFDHSVTAANLVSSLFRIARSYGASCFVASQSYQDVAESRAATAMMANASVYVLLRHNAQHEAVAKTFGLSDRQLRLFEKLDFRPGEYGEQLYVDKHDNVATVLRYSPTPWELWIDTSRAIDVELRQYVIRRMGNATAALAYLADTFPHGATPEALEAERRRAAQETR